MVTDRVYFFCHENFTKSFLIFQCFLVVDLGPVINNGDGGYKTGWGTSKVLPLQIKGGRVEVSAMLMGGMNTFLGTFNRELEFLAVLKRSQNVSTL